MKANLSGVYLKKGQSIEIDGKFYILKDWSLCIRENDAGKMLTLEKMSDDPRRHLSGEEIGVFSGDLKNALGMEIFGYME